MHFFVIQEVSLENESEYDKIQAWVIHDADNIVQKILLV